MSDTAAPRSVADRIEAIEQAYELMLAYAAQGRQSDDDDSSSIRRYMLRASMALDGFAEAIRESVADQIEACGDFISVLERDAHAAGAALRMVLARPVLSSQLIDNLNASIHVRALLTDVFLIDEVLKSEPGHA